MTNAILLHQGGDIHIWWATVAQIKGLNKPSQRAFLWTYSIAMRRLQPLIAWQLPIGWYFSFTVLWNVRLLRLQKLNSKLIFTPSKKCWTMPCPIHAVKRLICEVRPSPGVTAWRIDWKKKGKQYVCGGDGEWGGEVKKESVCLSIREKGKKRERETDKERE